MKFRPAMHATVGEHGRRRTAATVGLVMVLAACGDDGNDLPSAAAPAADPGVIEVSMTEMAFSPATLDVGVGDTITFVFHNDGVVRHEAVVGDEAAQEAHHDEMAEMAAAGESHDASPSHDDEGAGSDTHDGDTADMHEMDEMDDTGAMDGMEAGHAVVVEPGETVELTYTFETAGPLVIGCHEPGHWEAGMRLDIDV